MRPVDIVHLCYLAPSAAGSVNRTLGRQVRKLTDFRHLGISYDKEARVDRLEEPFIVLGGKAAWPVKLALHMVPGRIRESALGGFSVEHSHWLARAKGLIRLARPSVIVSHDHYKVGRWLRRWIDWPCRLVLKQHGFHYFDPAFTRDVNHFDVVVYLSRAGYEYCREHTHALEVEAEFIPNPVDGSVFRPPNAETRIQARRVFGIAEDSLVFLSVGRQVRKKGGHIVLRAWRQFAERNPRAILWVVGPIARDSFSMELRRLAALSGFADRVRFEGGVSAELVPQVLQASDVFLFPSLCHEGLPLAMLEALSTGLVCVSSRRAEIEENCGFGGVLWVDLPNRVDSWVDAMQMAAERISSRLVSAEAQWAWASERYCEVRILERWREFYRTQIAIARSGV